MCDATHIKVLADRGLDAHVCRHATLPNPLETTRHAQPQPCHGEAALDAKRRRWMRCQKRQKRQQIHVRHHRQVPEHRVASSGGQSLQSHTLTPQ
jgi:hypothetical protein